MRETVTEHGRRFLYYQTWIQINGNRELRLENCKRILEYNDIRILLQTTDLQLQIWGRDLRVDTSSSTGMLIRGVIQSVELLPKGGCS